MKSHATDMTTGSPVGHIIRFALPALVGNIFQQIYNLADSIIVGRFVGANALAAVGATASITFLFFALCNGIASGGGIVRLNASSSYSAPTSLGCGTLVASRVAASGQAQVRTPASSSTA